LSATKIVPHTKSLKNKIKDGGKDREGDKPMKTYYFTDSDGIKHEVEVTDEMYEKLAEMRREEWRSEAKERYYRAGSLDVMNEYDEELADPTLNPLDAMCGEINEEERKAKVRAAIAALTPEQKKLVALILSNKKDADIAAELKVNKSSICRMRQRVQKIFADFLKTDGNF
jgi:DNA-directed RNA polymerase specialized sigma24 family protein